MKKVIIIILGIILLTTIIVLLKNDLSFIEINNESTEVTSATSSTLLNIPKPLTLDSLKAREDWDPTAEAEGIARVEDGVAKLSNSTVEVRTNQIMADKNQPADSTLTPSGFTIIQAESTYDYSPNNKNCRDYIPSGSNVAKRDCLSTPLQDLNELIIISDDTGEVLHKFKLDEKYSLAGERWSKSDIRVVSTGSNILHNDTNLPIDIYKWNDWNDEEPMIRLLYFLDLLTGRITKERSTPL